MAANDPLFRNVTTNNWSGQAEALTYQRAIRALENYGMYEPVSYTHLLFALKHRGAPQVFLG